MEDTKKNIYRAVKDALRWQLIIMMFLAFVSWTYVGFHAAASTILGGFAIILGGYIGVGAIRNSSNATAGTILIAMLKAEAVRIIIIIFILLIAFKFYKELVPMALIGGLAATALISGVGLRTLGNENK